MGLQSIGFNFQRLCRSSPRRQAGISRNDSIANQNVFEASLCLDVPFCTPGWSAQQLGKSLVVAEKKQSTRPDNAGENGVVEIIEALQRPMFRLGRPYRSGDAFLVNTANLRSDLLKNCSAQILAERDSEEEL